MERYIEAFGAKKSPKDVRDYKLASVSNVEYPKEFSLTPPPIKNQMACSSCVAHSLAEIVEYHNKRQNDDDSKMSIVWIYGNRLNTSYQSKGMYLREALSNMINYGDATYSELSGNMEVPKAIEVFNENKDRLFESAYKQRFSSYYRVNNEQEIKQALTTHGPVAFVIEWYKDFKVVNGVLDSEKKKDYSGCHCMIIYGWNEQGWLIQNSWGSLWHGGRVILPYDIPLCEAWGISDDIIKDKDDSDIVKPFDSKIGRVVAKVVNLILRAYDEFIKLFKA